MVVHERWSLHADGRLSRFDCIFEYYYQNFGTVYFHCTEHALEDN